MTINMLANYTFKEIPPADLEAAIELVWTVFLEFEAPEYSELGVAEFRRFIEFEVMQARIESGDMFLLGCYDGINLAGVIGYNSKPHINLLFVDKNYHRQGIAKTLFAQMLTRCQSQNISPPVTVNSSPYAHLIYRQMGFSDTDSEQTVNGIRFIPMRYR